MKKIIDILLNILIVVFGIVLLFSIYTSFQTRVLGNDYGNFFGYTVFEVQTGSMADSINPSDWVVVKQTQAVKLGDVITYKLGTEYITHRVIESYNGTFITKGDANNTKDEPVDQSQIVGKVVNTLPNFGIIRKTLLEPAVLIVFIITLLIINMFFTKKNPEVAEKDKRHLDSLENLFKTILRILIGPQYRKPPQKKNEKPKEEKQERKIAVKISGSDNLYEEIKNKNLEDDEDYNPSQSVPDNFENTRVFRIVSVDPEEISSDKKQGIIDDIIEPLDHAIAKQSEVDLEKTAYFRAVSVDADEIDNTLMEIAQHQVDDPEKEEIDKSDDVEILEMEEIETPEKEISILTDIELEMLNSIRNSRSKNIIEKSVKIKKREIEEIMEVFFNAEGIKGQIARARESLIDAYIGAKYYNLYGKEKVGFTGTNFSKIRTVMKKEAKNLIDTYKGSYENYEQVINSYRNVMLIIIDYLEARDKITNEKALIEYCEQAINKYFKKLTTPDIMKFKAIIKKCDRVFESFLEDFKSRTFELTLNIVYSKKNMYALELGHNIDFSDIYNDTIIDNIYNKGVVAEDKMKILLTLLSVRLVTDMAESNFKNEYIFYLPSSLYGKKRKINTVLRTFDDLYAKNNTIILIGYNDLIKNTKAIKEIRKQGYRFALVLNKPEKMTAKIKGYMHIFDYIFVDKKNQQYSEIIKPIPTELSKNIINDNIVEKVGEFGGDL